MRVSELKELGAANADEFREHVRAALGDGKKSIEIDLAETTFVDSCGLGALIAIRNMIDRQGGVVRLLNPARSAQRILELTRLHRIFEITRRETVATG